MNSTTTTYVSFTPNGGRFGRIAWSNGDEDNWGQVCWDHHWPNDPLQLWEALAKTVADVLQCLNTSAFAANTFAKEYTKSFSTFRAILNKYNATPKP